jgi:hypothetical protein
VVRCGGVGVKAFRLAAHVIRGQGRVVEVEAARGAGWWRGRRDWWPKRCRHGNCPREAEEEERAAQGRHSGSESVTKKTVSVFTVNKELIISAWLC